MKARVIIPLALLLSTFPFTLHSQMSWQKYESNPVIASSNHLGISGMPDDIFAFTPCVVAQDGGYRMWYSGMRGYYDFSISEAWSNDGRRWFVSKVPVLSPGGFDATGLRGPCVVKRPGGYNMYYYTGSGSSLKIGLATSEDGNTWTKYEGNPVLAPGEAGSWESVGVWAPMVTFEGGRFRMWYEGFDGQWASIGHATSEDGIHWTKDGANPVVPHGSSPDFDFRSAGEPRVLRIRFQYLLFYTGTNGSQSNSVGLATSRDGRTWTKHGPVLLPTAGAWDRSHTAACAVVLKDETLHMWYSGGSGSDWQIGYASCPYRTEDVDPLDQSALRIRSNYPNPFNPITTLSFVVPTAGRVRIVIYDMLGRVVRQLVDREMADGERTITWDGTADNGSQVASGSYVSRIEFLPPGATPSSAVQKMMIVR